MRRVLVSLVFGTLLLPFFAFAQQPLPGFGLIKNTVWYSLDPFFADESIRVYSGLFNGSKEDVTGVASFYDNDVLIGARDFSIQTGAFTPIWVDWRPNKGAHVVKVILTSATIERVGGEKVSIVLSNQPVGLDERVVDSDFDGDRIGDSQDEDDDNDGLSDVDEVARGTDPLNLDTDGDGLLDGLDPNPFTQNVDTGPLSTEKKDILSGALSETKTFFQSTTTANALSSVSDVAVSYYNAVSDFAENQERGLRDKAAEVDLQIEELKVRGEHMVVDENRVDLNEALGDEFFPTESRRYDFDAILLRIAKQAYALFLDFAIFIFSYEIIIHLLLAHILYKLIRWIVRKFTWRRAID